MGGIFSFAPLGYGYRPADLPTNGGLFMWYPFYGSFRAGGVSNNSWGDGRVGFYSTAFGYGNVASAYTSFAGGEYTRADGANSTTFGEFTVAKTQNAFVVGMYNDTSAANLLLAVGNGTGGSTRKNAFTILADGKAGFGENLPSASLHVSSISSTSTPQMLLQVTNAGYSRLRMSSKNAAGPYWDMAGFTNTSNAANSEMNFFYTHTGGTGLNVLSLKGNGNAVLAGTLTENSDARLKKNITLINNPLQQLRQLNGYHYYWKDLARDKIIVCKRECLHRK